MVKGIKPLRYFGLAGLGLIVQVNFRCGGVTVPHVFLRQIKIPGKLHYSRARSMPQAMGRYAFAVISCGLHCLFKHRAYSRGGYALAAAAVAGAYKKGAAAGGVISAAADIIIKGRFDFRGKGLAGVRFAVAFAPNINKRLPAFRLYVPDICPAYFHGAQTAVYSK